MQLTEASMTGVRSAPISVRAPGTALRFLQVPMIHLGSAAFYQAVTARLGQCQVIVAEGVGGRSLWTRALTTAYRSPARSRRLGLVVQDIDLAALAAASAVVIIPDLTADQARQGWRGIPWLQRLALLGLAPAVAVALRVIGTRRLFARHLAAEDLPSMDEQQISQAYPALTKLLTDDRDRLLVDALAALIEARSGDDIEVAVVYGAAHMRAVASALAARGFRPRQAEWLTVFDL
jgi:hypothetical protein